MAAWPAFSADRDYNGRWDITTATGARARWLELTGVGTKNPAGKFVSAYGGDLNKIDTISVQNGELHFTILAPKPDPARPAPARPRAKRAKRARRARRALNWNAWHGR